MLVRLLYAALFLTLLGAFPRSATVRAAGGRSEASAAVTGPTWAPRPMPERYCAAEDRLDIGDIGPAPDFAIPRIDR
ncbi:MAG TPA: hypothetical protein VIV57_27025 [Anaeromyxobacter sp.]